MKHKLAYTLLFLMLAGVTAIEEHRIHNLDCELYATKEGEKCLLEDMDSIHNLAKEHLDDIDSPQSKITYDDYANLVIKIERITDQYKK